MLFQIVVSQPLEQIAHLAQLGDAEGEERRANPLKATVQALGMYAFALVSAVALEGHDSLDVAASFNNQGHFYHRIGQNEQALEYYQKSLDIIIQVAGDHALVATSLLNIQT